MRLQAHQTYNIDDLVIWKRHIADGHALQLPMYSARTNPLLLGELVIVTLCSSKRLSAYHRDTGEPLWKIDLGFLAGSYVDAANGLAYTTTSGGFLCIDPAGGRIVWSFSPRGGSEHIYAGPAFSDGLVIFGDRQGSLHCFEATTGNRVWKVDLDPDAKWDINATACIFGDRVVGCDIRGTIAAYETQTGNLIWRSRFRRGSIFEIMNLEGDALITGTEEIYRYSVSTGEEIQCLLVENTEARGAAIAAGRYVCAILEDLAAEKRLHDDLRALRKKNYPELRMEIVDDSSTTSLASLLPDGLAWRLKYPLYSAVHVRWDEPTWLIYEATNHGIGMIDATTGERRVLIVADANDDIGMVYFSPPAVSGDRIYALTGGGDLYCLRRPN